MCLIIINLIKYLEESIQVGLECNMPKALEQKLKKQAKKKGLSKKRSDAYVYGSLRKTGWKPKKK